MRPNFGPQYVKSSYTEIAENAILAFEDRTEAIKWCILRIESEEKLHDSALTISDVECKSFIVQSTVAALMYRHGVPVIGSDEDAVKAFSTLLDAERLFQIIFPSSLDSPVGKNPETLSTLVAELKAAGGRIRRYNPQQLITTKG